MFKNAASCKSIALKSSFMRRIATKIVKRDKIFYICRKQGVETSVYTIGLAQFSRLFPVSERVCMGDDLCLVDAGYDGSLSVLTHPCRFDGYLAMFCVSGRMKVMVNMTEFDVTENSLFVYMPGNIISVPEIGEDQRAGLRVILIAMTKEYMGSLKTDVPNLIWNGQVFLGNPFFVIKDGEKKIAERYMTLAVDILESNLSYKRESISLLLSSVFFLAGGVIEQRLNDAGTDRKSGPSSGHRTKAICRPDRSKEVSDKFLGLVAEYHTKERLVSFYAGKLCITPKYLSRLVKQATGKSASDWIDDYVILEARNMLRYTSLPVKDIVSGLSFPDSASFYKFFKSRTGMTPLQYRRS